MVLRAHEGYAMRHAWQHWHWLASSKVLLRLSCMVPIVTMKLSA